MGFKTREEQRAETAALDKEIFLAECPYCGAKSGEACHPVKARGEFKLSFSSAPHILRVRKAHKVWVEARKEAAK